MGGGACIAEPSMESVQGSSLPATPVITIMPSKTRCEYGENDVGDYCRRQTDAIDWMRMNPGYFLLPLADKQQLTLPIACNH